MMNRKPSSASRFKSKLTLVSLTATLISSLQPQPNLLHKHYVKSSSSSLTQINSHPMSSSSSSTSSPLSSSSPIHRINGIQEISDSYSTYLLDMWGVMHNGSKTYDGVIETIQNLTNQNPKKKLIILSNSSKRMDNSIKMLTKLGFDPENDFCQIITSGDVSYRMLSGDKTLQCSTWDVIEELIKTNQKNVFVFGSGDKDEEYCESAGWTLSSIEDANLIIARGTFTLNNGSGKIVSKHDNEEEYFQALEDTLSVASKRNIPMLVTNPDKVRPDKGLPPMPGAIGDAYEEYLQTVGIDDSTKFVKRIGKPYSEVYEIALDSCEDGEKAIMVGDALETDITGGTWSKIDTLWVVDDGIHAPFVNDGEGNSYDENLAIALNDFNEKKGYTDDGKLKPTFVTRHFNW